MQILHCSILIAQPFQLQGDSMGYLWTPKDTCYVCVTVMQWVACGRRIAEVEQELKDAQHAHSIKEASLQQYIGKMQTHIFEFHYRHMAAVHEMKVLKDGLAASSRRDVELRRNLDAAAAQVRFWPLGMHTLWHCPHTARSRSKAEALSTTRWPGMNKHLFTQTYWQTKHIGVVCAIAKLSALL
jgi:hypothetical protein